MAPPPPPSAGEVAWQYLQLGYTHILPKGLDHILFVVGIFLFRIRERFDSVDVQALEQFRGGQP